MSRETKLTPEVQEKICALIQAGDRPEVAAGVNGIGRSTYFDWMNRSDEPFASFRIAVARALDIFESESRKIILDGDDRSWSSGPAKMRLETLSRRMPRHWAQQVRHHVEKVEDEFLDVLEAVCGDPAVYARVCEEKDLRIVIEAFCTALASLESETEAGTDTRSAASPIH